MQEKLKKATAYLNQHQDQTAQSNYYQTRHFCSPVGWMNDPNGFIYYQHAYHLFFQYYPYAPSWHTMYWGHAKSTNLLDWEQLPLALAPSEVYDDDENGGCFSGTAIEKDGKLCLFYTGCITGSDGEFIQTQCLATSDDGLNFIKHDNNPLIETTYPGVKASEFRDPKVWVNGGIYFMLVGVSVHGKGNAILYRSLDALDWHLIGPIVDENRDDLGTMWECPDYFEIAGKSVLIFSPLGLGDCLTVYLIGQLDYDTGKFSIDSQGQADYGTDFYAPQTLQDDTGTYFMIGWQNGWDWMPKWQGFGPTDADGWSGSMSLPRQVVMNDQGTLSFLPLPALKHSYANQLVKKEVSLTSSLQTVFNQVRESFQLVLTCSVSNHDYKIEMSSPTGEKDMIYISQDAIRYDSVANKHGKVAVRMPVISDDIHLTIISDTLSLEIFEMVSGRVMSVNHYQVKGERTIKMCCEQASIVPTIELFEFTT